MNFSKFRNGFLNYKFFLVSILLIAFILRFYRYSDRWALSYDHAWFAVIARHAIDIFEIPFLGPFASGGPFQTGGEWFWIIMAGILLNPTEVVSPWIFITLLSIFQVFLAFILGKELSGIKFGLLLAFLNSISASQVVQATNLTSPTTESFFSTLLLIFLFKYSKIPHNKFIFLASFIIGFASAVHAQGIMLALPLLVFIALYKIYNLKKIFLIFLGITIPWLPVLAVDVQNNFYNTKNMLGYFSSNQTKATYEELGRRWLTFMTNYIPFTWGRIIGGNTLIGFIEIGLIASIIIRDFLKRKINKFILFVVVSLSGIFVVLRYTKAPLFENYTTFLHPFVLLLTSYGIYKLYKLNKIISMVFLLIISYFTIQNSLSEINVSTNLTAKETKRLVEILKRKYPKKSFSVYDFDYKHGHSSLPLVYFLQTEGLTNDQGIKIGVVTASPSALPRFQMHKVIDGEIGYAQLLELASESGELMKNDWAPVNPNVIYDSVQYWYKKQSLQGTK